MAKVRLASFSALSFFAMLISFLVIATTPLPGHAQQQQVRNNDPDSCTPAMPARAVRGLFLWKDCAGRWHLRAGSVRPDRVVRLVGSFESSAGFSNVTGFDMEANDYLDSRQSNELLIDFAFGGQEYDGLAFDTPAGATLCVELNISDGPLPVSVGRQRIRASGKFNAETLRPCG